MPPKKPKPLSERIPPSAIPSEMAILGACLTWRDEAVAMSTRLTADMFRRLTHATIFASVLRLLAEGGEINALSIKRDISAHDTLDNVHAPDPLAYLLSLQDYANISGIDTHIESIICAYAKRRLIEGATRALANAHEEGYDIGEAATGLIACAQSVIDGGDTEKREDMASLMDEMLAMERPEAFSTGFHDFDSQYMGGLHPGLTIMAGPTGSGKTTLMTSWAVRAAKAGVPGYWFMGDMNRLKLGAYLLSSEAKMTEDDLWAASNPIAVQNKVDAAARLAGLPVERYSGEMTAPRIEAMIRAKAAQGVRWFLIDSLQLVTVPGETNEWRSAEKFARTLQAIATQLCVYVISTCEWKKQDDPIVRRSDREKRWPNRNDYKGGGGVAHACDEFVICWPPKENETVDYWLIVDKSRSGPVPRCIMLKFIGAEHRFEEVREMV